MAIPIIAGVGLTIAGTAMQIAGTMQSAASQASIVRHNAEQAQQDAISAAGLREREAQAAEAQLRTERQATALETRILRERERFRRGAEETTVAAAGFEFEGSPLMVATRRAREAEMEIELNEFASEQRQSQLIDTAAMRRFEATEFRRRGREALQVGGFRSQVIRQTATTQALSQGIGGATQSARMLLTPR